MPHAFDSVYLDTEVLTSVRWPNESMELHNFLFLAQMLGVKVFIPEGAEMERHRGWLEDIDSEITRLRSIIDKLSRWRLDPDSLTVPNADQIDHAYSEMAMSLKKKWRIETVPLTKREPRELFEMAIRRKPPFKQLEKGVVGFQDTAIYLSVVDHLQKTPAAPAAFVSKDHIFKEVNVGELAKTGGVEIEVLSKLEDVIIRLKERLADDPKRLWELDVHSAERALEHNHKALEDFFHREFGGRVNQFATAGETLHLESVHIAEIKNVQTPPLPERLADQKIRLTFDVSATLHLSVVAIFDSQLAPANMHIVRNPERVVGIEAKVEAEALARGDRYEDVKPLSIINAAAYYAPSSVLEYDEM